MSDHNMKKLTIVVERLLKDKIIAAMMEAGATGFTYLACEGKGSRGDNPSDWEGRNLEIYTISDEEVCMAILDGIGKYMENYSIIAFMTDVAVVRHKKFS